MKIRILGAGGSMANGRLSTSILIDDRVLIDAGTGLATLSVDEMLGIRKVFLTHSHIDHIAALSALGDMRLGQEPPLELHARPETLDALDRHFFNNVLWPDFTAIPSRGEPVFLPSPMQPGQAVEAESVTLTAFRAEHPVPALGFHVRDKSSSIVFSGDTGPGGEMIDVLHSHPDLDLLIVECAFPDRMAEIARLAGHYTPSRLAFDLAPLPHPQRRAITHLKPGLEDEIRRDFRKHGLDHVTFVDDGEIFRL